MMADRWYTVHEERFDLLVRQAAAYLKIKEECANTKLRFKLMAIERIIEETEGANA